MKNPKNLTLNQKLMLESEGYDSNCYKIIKNTSEFQEFLNIETGVSFKIWR